MKRRRGQRIYLAELDVHFPELTVGETLAFATSARTSSNRLNGTTLRNIAHMVTTLFHLDDAYNTQIGDAMIRGVSGGEKRRTSLAEAFIADAEFQFWDNSTRGLDSSTALHFIKTLREWSHTRHFSVAMSLYQASEAMYEVCSTASHFVVLY